MTIEIGMISLQNFIKSVELLIKVPEHTKQLAKYSHGITPDK